METANDDFIGAVPAWKNSMASRDARLYDDTDSIFERQKLVKEYVKSLYGSSSPQHAQVKGLEFKKVKYKVYNFLLFDRLRILRGPFVLAVMARFKPKGNCKICGDFGELTFEHLPPRSSLTARGVLCIR